MATPVHPVDGQVDDEPMETMSPANRELFTKKVFSPSPINLVLLGMVHGPVMYMCVAGSSTVTGEELTVALRKGSRVQGIDRASALGAKPRASITAPGPFGSSAKKMLLTVAHTSPASNVFASIKAGDPVTWVGVSYTPLLPCCA